MERFANARAFRLAARFRRRSARAFLLAAFRALALRLASSRALRLAAFLAFLLAALRALRLAMRFLLGLSSLLFSSQLWPLAYEPSQPFFWPSL